jgi:toxin ParE1/3/4
MLAFAVTRRADRDIERASDWYARASARLAVAFLDDVQDTIDVARARPMSFAEVRRGIRRVMCSRFPYYVYFEVLSVQIDILAVYHTSRDQARWDDRNRE